MTLTNPVTGERMRVERSASEGGESHIVFTLPPRQDGPPLHFHTRYDEHFAVLDGELELRLELRGAMLTQTLRRGDARRVPAGTLHAFRNASDAPVTFRAVATDGLGFERFIRGWYGVAIDGQSTAAGPKSLLDLLVLIELGDVNLPRIPRALQHALRAIGGWLARATGRERRIAAWWRATPSVTNAIALAFLLGSLLAASPTLAQPRVAVGPFDRAAAVDVRVRPLVSFGFAFSVVGVDTYGIAADLHVGADLEFGQERSHQLMLTLGWTPYTLTGARLDLFALGGGWRWRPAPEVGFYVAITAGLVLGREALDVSVGGQQFRDELVAPGGVASIAVGWTLFEHVDVQLSYRQALLGMGSVESLGSVNGTIGGRL